MNPSTILSTVSRSVLPTVFVFSVFLLSSGHAYPGGGFIGGLVAAAGLVVLWANGGAALVRKILRVRPELLLALGLLAAYTSAVLGWVLGSEMLESTLIRWTMPVFGPITLATYLIFDTGVYLVVIGLTGMILTTLGAEEPRDPVPARGGER